jgi:hypothetical protein
VVFDLGPALLQPDPPPSRIEPVVWPTAITRPPETVQRQEATEPAATPDRESPSTTTPVVASTTTPVVASTAALAEPSAVASPAAASTPPATAAATPSIDELARQLFGPLTARLKAELRLDRERSGLLTDLRQ